MTTEISITQPFDLSGGPHLPDDGGQASAMSLRDWFAGQALPQVWRVERWRLEGLTQNDRLKAIETIMADTAMSCYQLADAMISKRKR